MKALFFTLLLLLIAISPSFTAPASSTHFAKKQKIVYTFVTAIGVINVECTWDPQLRSLVPGAARHVEFENRGEFIRVSILERRTRRWNFEAARPSSMEVRVAAEFSFYPQYYQGDGLPPGSLNPGITIMDPLTFSLWHLRLTQRKGEDANWQRTVNESPLAIDFVFRSVMRLGSRTLDDQTESTLRSPQGINAFLQQGAGPLPDQCPLLRLQLDGGI
jgi:hypothetical protein